MKKTAKLFFYQTAIEGGIRDSRAVHAVVAHGNRASERSDTLTISVVIFEFTHMISRLQHVYGQFSSMVEDVYFAMKP